MRGRTVAILAGSVLTLLVAYLFVARSVHFAYLDGLVHATDRGFAPWTNEEKQAFFNQKTVSKAQIENAIINSTFIIPFYWGVRKSGTLHYDNDVRYFSNDRVIQWRTTGPNIAAPDLRRGHWWIETYLRISFSENDWNLRLLNNLCWRFEAIDANEQCYPALVNTQFGSDEIDINALFGSNSQVQQLPGDPFHLSVAKLPPFLLSHDAPATAEGLLNTFSQTHF